MQRQLPEDKAGRLIELEAGLHLSRPNMATLRPMHVVLAVRSAVRATVWRE
jgi:hypothetical protein